MKKSTLVLGLFIVILSACNDSPQNEKQSNGSTLKQDTIKKSTMKGFNNNIEKETLKNEDFRNVLYTSKNLQLVLMSLKPGEDIGSEIHVNSDQFFRFESGKGKVIVNDNEYTVEAGDVIVVPLGSRHNVINTDSTEELKMYTIYAFPQHKVGIVRATKKEAQEHADKFDGTTTE